ncbi:hypothetical protein [Ruminiclostridium cellulolyticum]|uniref:Uncharacterized protein n=1 Tax=Ruminiclostridium cellulolyticum (strain ATCC 35319 / DSM 5812 / JCM 6584 / H10) TaxID=394503 RepID=B8I8I0_RUMCH|nr:hypothetical protein [Ruminiclostridium cellulolyticum]ACL75213.1 hypothetical protein Ccel_0836 [Ruminiclostridium cellulolyticum H10]
MNENRPIIITMIGDLSILSGMLTIGAIIFPGYFAKLGFHMNPLPIYSNIVMNIILTLIFITASVGLLWLKKWGYWLTIVYHFFYLLINVIWHLQNKQVPLSLTIVVALVIIIDIIPYRKYFT